MDIAKIRNIAIVAHVDHGKTTLVDQLLKQAGVFRQNQPLQERVLDSMELERERGITILAKNTAIFWQDYKINLVDTPGHADFGGEVERILSMVDAVLLLVDAVEGPMPQTRFVTQKAIERGLKPIVVINKIDRQGARPDWVLDQTFDLLDRLGASEEQLDFPVVYTSALYGYAGHDPDRLADDMTPLFETIVEHVPPPKVNPEGSLQLQICSLDYDPYVGLIGIGRIQRGKIRRNMEVAVVDREGKVSLGRISRLYHFRNLKRQEIEEASVGDIVAVAGIETLSISATLCSPDQIEPLPLLEVDEPTVTMTFEVNTSPFAGRDGQFLTSRQIRERLFLEQKHNVALRVEETDDPNRFKVSGRGVLHLSILIETMRREGYEFAVSRPEVILKEIDGKLCEPFEWVTVEIDGSHQGAVMELFGARQAELQDMVPMPDGRLRMEFLMPSRCVMGLRTPFLSATSGTGLLYHRFEKYAPTRGEIARRVSGVLISSTSGKALAYALYHLQPRGRLFIAPGEEVYEGMIVGIHNRPHDLTVNPTKAKHLTNIRAVGSDENLILTPPLRFSLEEALEFIEADELVEITPKAIRLRKKFLKEHERKRFTRRKVA